MSERKTVYILNSSNIGKAANSIAVILKNHTKEDPCPREKLAEDTNLTTGQISTVIKYMRRCSERDLERFIRYYPISSKKGYYLPASFEDFAPCYATLEKWLASLKRTIEPMRKKMEEEGIDWREYLPGDEAEEIENYLDKISETNKDTSWFLDK